jgi:pilus assembly protein CpaC
MSLGKFGKGIPKRPWRLRLCLGLCLAGAPLAARPKDDTPTSQPSAPPAILSMGKPRAAVNGLPSCPPEAVGAPLPERQRPTTGPGSIAEFIDNLSTNDAVFEVIVNEGRILTAKADLAVPGKRAALVAAGDPSIADFNVINSRQIRVVGRRTGVTDLSITTADNQTYQFEVRVVADLAPLRGKLCSLFPDACLKLVQVRDHIAVEGQARDAAQVEKILETIRAYLFSVEIGQARKTSGQQTGGLTQPPGAAPPAPIPGEQGPGAMPIGLEQPQNIQGTIATPRIINLIRVPGSQQVLIKVRVAELDRTALRQVGTDFLVDSRNVKIGSQIGSASVNAALSRVEAPNVASPAGLLQGIAASAVGSSTTLFGIFERADFAIFFNALRRNSLIKILAEPNLVALNGHEASFLAGGSFPIPVPQSGAGGGAATITVTYKDFGVQLRFTPTIIDGDIIRLSVDPDVSTLDFAIGTVIVPGTNPVPGLNERRAHTVVELREGQTLAMAGLMSVSLDAQTTRIPGLGDLPILGPFFSNTTNTRTEKELIVLVTPYLVEPMAACQVPPSPGSEVNEPTDLEFYIGNRIEGRKGIDFRSTVNYDLQSPMLQKLLHLDEHHVRGPFGYCEEK